MNKKNINRRYFLKAGALGLAGAPLLGGPSARGQDAVKVIAIDGERLLSLFNKDPKMGFRVMSGLVDVVSARMKSVKQTLLA